MQQPKLSLPAGVRALGHFTHDGLRVESYRLANGLKLLYLPDPAGTVYSYQTWFRVGSRDEVAGHTGLAHLFEHLMFRETHTHPAGELDRRVEALGGRTNAGTWLDWTYYHIDAPAGPLETVVALEADRMRHLKLDPAALEAEREVVLNERKEYVDNDPGGLLSELLWHTALGEHPYGHPTLGWAADVEALSRAECLAFYDTWYAPNNAVLAVAGAVDRAALLSLVAAHYGAMEPRDLPARPPATPVVPEGPTHLVRALPLSADRLLMGYPAPALTDARSPTLELLNAALFGGDSSRLYRALVTEGELATSAGAFPPTFREASLYEISVDMRPGHAAEEAEAIILAGFAEVAASGLKTAELDRARDRLEAEFYRGLQTAEQRARALGFWELTAGDFRALFEVSDRLRAVDSAQVQALARAMLAPALRTVVIGRADGEAP